jgi:hypothetical protein
MLGKRGQMAGEKGVLRDRFGAVFDQFRRFRDRFGPFFSLFGAIFDVILQEFFEFLGMVAGFAVWRVGQGAGFMAAMLLDWKDKTLYHGTHGKTRKNTGSSGHGSGAFCAGCGIARPNPNPIRTANAVRRSGCREGL